MKQARKSNRSGLDDAIVGPHLHVQVCTDLALNVQGTLQAVTFNMVHVIFLSKIESGGRGVSGKEIRYRYPIPCVRTDPRFKISSVGVINFLHMASITLTTFLSNHVYLESLGLAEHLPI